MAADAIAVTGASGFVGRYVVAAAASEGIEVIGLHRQPGGAEVIRDAGGRPVQVHSLHPDTLARAFEGCAAVVHLAQIGSEKAGATYEAVNVGGTRHLIDAAQRAGIGSCAYLSGLGVAHYGMTRRCTNRYFLSKLQCEVELFKSDLRVVVFRPSYILGAGNELIEAVVGQMAAGNVEVVGDGSYRLQPLCVLDAAQAVVQALQHEERRHAVYDFVGPEAVTYHQFLDRLTRAAGRGGRAPSFTRSAVAVETAEAQAANGGYQGMGPDSLDCLLGDETADPEPLARLLGRPLRSIDETLEGSLAAATPLS